MAIQQGWNQMTAATQHTIRKAFGRVAGTRRRRKAAKRSTTKRKSGARRRAAARGRKAQRFVKGSAAARRYMAKIRKLRKR